MLQSFQYLPRLRRAAVVKWSDYSPSTKVKAGSLPDFRARESCRTMPLVGGFSRRTPVLSSSLHSGAAPSSLASPSSALKTPMLRAAQLTPLQGYNSIDSQEWKCSGAIGSHLIDKKSYIQETCTTFDPRAALECRILLKVSCPTLLQIDTRLQRSGREILAILCVGGGQASLVEPVHRVNENTRSNNHLLPRTPARARQQHVGRPFASQRLVTYSPAGSSANRQPLEARSGQSGTSMFPDPRVTQSAKSLNNPRRPSPSVVSSLGRGERPDHKLREGRQASRVFGCRAITLVNKPWLAFCRSPTAISLQLVSAWRCLASQMTARD
ncbi:hypothetical protein PR048_027156 [Dryococelus australis]|uniref:Uncharacterized protein n=1 Tax=Dryococelus australis TaxID=614101 RepID=A0ABQ9GEN4_9NEOP|nr:hypothetical protein PR048_027156 [Dryococelus australis]